MKSRVHASRASLIATALVALALAGSARAADEIDPGALKNLEAAYPRAPAGRERKVVLLPHVERGADDDLQVEIVVGRVIETDGINAYGFGGAIHERNIDGWGFSYYEVEGDLKQAASTLIGGPPNPAPRFVAGPRTLVRYNSRLPLVVMVPEGCELRWRLWKADGEWRSADAAAKPALKPTAAEAEAAAAAWLERLGDRGLVLDERFDDTGFVVRYGDSAVGRVTTFELDQGDYRVSFTFRGEHPAATPLVTLREQFWHAVIDRVPTPDFEVPGWETRPLTPTSSFEQGVELVSLADGRATFRVRTEFFALSGTDPTVIVPADAPAPEGSFFQLRRRFPLDLTLSAPVTFPR